MYEHRCAKWCLWDMPGRCHTDVAESLKSHFSHFGYFALFCYSRRTRNERWGEVLRTVSLYFLSAIKWQKMGPARGCSSAFSLGKRTPLDELENAVACRRHASVRDSNHRFKVRHYPILACSTFRSCLPLFSCSPPILSAAKTVSIHA